MHSGCKDVGSPVEGGVASVASMELTLTVTKYMLFESDEENIC